MNTTILTQQSANVKPSPKVIPSIAWAWGFEDGARRKSIYIGYHLFAGAKLAEYKQGWAEGHSRLQAAITANYQRHLNGK